MQDSIEIDTLKKYLDDELSDSEKRRVEQCMMQHRHYFKILRGLNQLRKDFGGDDADLEKYLSENLNKQASSLFNKK